MVQLASIIIPFDEEPDSVVEVAHRKTKQEIPCNNHMHFIDNLDSRKARATKFSIEL